MVIIFRFTRFGLAVGVKCPDFWVSIPLITKNLTQMQSPKNSRVIEHPIFGDRVTFIETAAETKGAYTLVYVELAPGATGPPPHYHNSYDEYFSTIDGVLGIQSGKKVIYLKKGESCIAQVGIPHRFFNPSTTDKVTFSAMITPASSNFETMLQVSYGLANDGLVNRQGMPARLEHMALNFMWGDTNLPGIFSIITPIMRWIARRAVRRGVDQELIARYCRF